MTWRGCVVGWAILFALATLPSCTSQKRSAVPADSGSESLADMPAVAKAGDVPHGPADENRAMQQSASEPASMPSSAESSASTEMTTMSDEALAGTFTTHRLFALATGGPRIIDLSVSIGGKSLIEASEAMAASVADEVFDELEQPVLWDTLHSHPLIGSGWLGNLIANEGQTAELVGMYDVNSDNIVSMDEFASFLTRGLARKDPMQLSDIGVAPEAQVNKSPWGSADQDENFTLDGNELQNLSTAVGQFDTNGDSIISVQEVSQARGMQMQAGGMANRSLLDTTTMLFEEDADSSDAETDSKAFRQTASKMLSHYTFLEVIPREQWNQWSDERWSQVDTNKDGKVTRNELLGLATLESDIRIVVRISPPDASDGSIRLLAVGGWGNQTQLWNTNGANGRWAVDGFVLEMSVEDGFSAVGRRGLRQRLEAALGNEQFRGFISGQLQLKEGAFGLLDADGDQKLSDDEFARAWRWLSVRQGTRLVARWMTAGTPWFQLLDLDGDQRLTQVELGKVERNLRGLDANADQSLTPDELPLLVRLEIRRNDDRLGGDDFGFPNPVGDESRDADWFAAMDSNRDGYVSKAEFLGDNDDFSAFDSNNDGFLERGEVY